MDYWTPTVVANEALDAAGLNFVLGDIEEGSEPAQICLRHYTTCMEQLFRAAPWNFARKQVPLQLIADASGQTTDPLVTTLVPLPWIYAYAYPTDCARIRYIPWNPFQEPAVPAANIVPDDSGVPLTTNFDANPMLGQRLVPARFLVTTDINNLPGGDPNSTPGISPIGRLVVRSSVLRWWLIWPQWWRFRFRQTSAWGWL